MNFITSAARAVFSRPSAEPQPLRAAVVGAGVFGGFHAQKYAALPGVELAAVVDVNPEAASAVAAKHGAEAFSRLDDILEDVDVVSITAPAALHYALARRTLDAGVHTLIEKPIALDLQHADELIALAKARGAVLQVGHQERYVFSQFGLLARRDDPLRIECRRAGPFSGRCMDVSVVMDLMIHDLDLVHQVAPSPVSKVTAKADFVHGSLADTVAAELELECGTEVALFASRAAEEKQRSMRLVYPDGEIFLDFVNRTLTNTTKVVLTPAFGGEDVDGMPSIASDPLGYGIGRFVHCARTGETPFVKGVEARRALETALRITDAHGSGAPAESLATA